jgi:hypothetical protein
MRLTCPGLGGNERLPVGGWISMEFRSLRLVERAGGIYMPVVAAQSV